MSAEKGRLLSMVRRLGDSRLAQKVLEDFIIPRMESKVFAAIHPEYAEGFDQAYQESIREGYVPVFLMNHQSHADGIPASKVSKRLTDLAQQARPEKPLQGFHLVISSTIKTGDQGRFLQEFTELLTPHFEARRMWLFPFTRETDQKEFGRKRGLKKFIDRMGEVITENYGLGFFPEAHMTGGRWKGGKSWQGINGLQPFNPREFNLKGILEIAHTQGKKLVFIPVGSHGGYKLLSPDTKLPHYRAFFGLFQEAPPNLVQTKVGRLITEDALEQMAKDTDETPHVILAKAIAELLPPQAQGVYRKSEETSLPRRGTIFSRAANLFRRGS